MILIEYGELQRSPSNGEIPRMGRSGQGTVEFPRHGSGPMDLAQMCAASSGMIEVETLNRGKPGVGSQGDDGSTKDYISIGSRRQ